MTSLLIAILAGIGAALIAGAISGLIIAKKAIGAEMAAGMGGLYGLIGGTAASVIGVITLSLIMGA